MAIARESARQKFGYCERAVRRLLTKLKTKIADNKGEQGQWQN